MSQQTNEAPNAEQTVAANAASTNTNTEDTERRIQKAREEEKRRLYAQIEQEKAERLALEKKLAEREKGEKEQKLYAAIKKTLRPNSGTRACGLF